MMSDVVAALGLLVGFGSFVWSYPINLHFALIGALLVLLGVYVRLGEDA